MAARSAIANGSFGAFAPRTIFIRASPPPLTFAERRAVLHALKRHCRIDFFRKIRNNPSSFLSLAESEDAARTLIARSPLKYQLEIDAEDHSPQEAPRNDDNPSDGMTSSDARPTAHHPAESSKEFTIHIFPRHTGKKHSELIEDSPLHGPWPGQPDATSFVARYLRRVIPDGTLKDGLADWETGGQLQEDGDALGKAADMGPRFYVQRRQRRRESKMGLSGVLEDTSVVE